MNRIALLGISRKWQVTKCRRHHFRFKFPRISFAMGLLLVRTSLIDLMLNKEGKALWSTQLFTISLVNAKVSSS